MRGSKLSVRRLIVKLFLCSVSMLIFFAFIEGSIELLYAPSVSSLYITAATDELTYHLRQYVNVSGTLMENGSPISDALISLEVQNPRGNAFLFRTIPIGNLTEEWIVEISEACIRNATGSPTGKALINSQVQLFVKIRNTLLNEVSGYLTATVYDGNLIPIRAAWKPISIPAKSEVSTYWTCYIPEWAYCGKATVHYNFYSNLPQNRGFPYVPEKIVEFYITRNPELGPPFRPPKSSHTTLPNYYSLIFQIPPDHYTLPGNYTVHVMGRLSLVLTAYATTTFNVQSPPSPPQAAFTYSPLQPYQNMTVTFDASSSSAEGYNDTITRYEWRINDPYNPEHIIETTPLINHIFQYDGTFTVELNVTDSEGLWSFTSKPVTILSEFGPTANFTWTPTILAANETGTFDASVSASGWSAATQEFSPITTYTWNFSDGTGNITVTTPIIDHAYTQPDNYTVTLTVIDAVGRSDTIFHVVEVQNRTFSIYDVNQDHMVDMMDLYLVALAYGSQPGDENWDPRCDVVKDDFIDMMDLYLVAIHYGETT